MRGRGTVSQPSAQHGGNVSGEKLSQRRFQGMFQNKTHASDETYYDEELPTVSTCVEGATYKVSQGTLQSVPDTG